MNNIRDHLRIDGDYEDAILALYVKAALSNAEKHTGHRFASAEITDIALVPACGANTFELDNDPTGPVVAFVGHQRYSVRMDGKTAVLPVWLPACDTSKVVFKYHVGPVQTECSDGLVDTDPAIEAGILKYVAYAWVHRGDAANNWMADSGALQEWQQFKPIYF